MKVKQNGGFSMVGASSLLVVFAVLCMTIFALLSVSTALAGARLSERSAQAVENYYAADLAAEQILAQLRAGESVENVTEDNGRYCYTCAISDTQALVVEVYIENKDYTVLRWQAVSTAEWQADEQLNVWDGEVRED